jgi:hypothetical protein
VLCCSFSAIFGRWEDWAMDRMDGIERGFVSVTVLSFLILIASAAALALA